jgi:class 3 adenylate cyclase
MTARLGDSAALELVRAHDALVRRGLEAYGGREIKHTGDGIMAAFDKVQNSVRAAADIQRRFAAYNADASETLSVRIGIDAGEPVEDHNDLFGSTVQLAPRPMQRSRAQGHRRFRIRARAAPGGGCGAVRGARRAAI